MIFVLSVTSHDAKALEKEFSEATMSGKPFSSLVRNSNLPAVNSVPLLDISRENSQLEPEILAAITQVTRSGRFVLGPEVQLLEQRVARLCNVDSGIGCASGSDAILLALMAAGVEQGDEVIIPSFTFFATASAATRLGATPVFVDIDPATYNISPDAVRAAVTSKTKAVIPVHLFGQPAAMDEINAIAKEHGMAVIEDAAQAIGAELNGKPVGSLGDMACFSFYPTKNLGGYGDGGMLTSKSEEYAEKLRLLRVHGMAPRYHHQVIGINSRLDTMQAAVLNVKLPHLQTWTDARIRNASRYHQLFEAAALTDYITLPACDTDRKHVWNQFTIRVPGSRDNLRKYLADRQVGSEIYYPIPLHKQECFAEYEQRFDLPETERASQEVISLPIYPMMTEAEQDYVVEQVASFVSQHLRVSDKAA